MGESLANLDDQQPEPVIALSEPNSEDALWFALCMAPEQGADIAELMSVTGMSRATLYRHLREHARAGRAVQISRGRWRAHTANGGGHE